MIGNDAITNMCCYLDLGPSTSARHTAFIGHSRSGKSTTVKSMVDQMLAKGIQVVAFDMKGVNTFWMTESFSGHDSGYEFWCGCGLALTWTASPGLLQRTATYEA